MDDETIRTQPATTPAGIPATAPAPVPVPTAAPVPAVTPGAPDSVRTGGDGTAPLRVAVVVGSVREGRFGPVVAGWFARRAEREPDLTVDLVDLVDLADLAGLGGAAGTGAMTWAGFGERIGAADAVVIVTPEYNHSYPGPLKTAIDGLGQQWHAKPVALVSYGGMSGGLRAVEPLRVVFAEVHAVTIRNTVSFHNAWERFDGRGEPLDSAAVDGAAKVLLDQLRWWGYALREARRAHPYAR